MSAPFVVRVGRPRRPRTEEGYVTSRLVSSGIDPLRTDHYAMLCKEYLRLEYRWESARRWRRRRVRRELAPEMIALAGRITQYKWILRNAKDAPFPPFVRRKDSW